jgi:DNA-binding IclR family transcriptional regulator
MDDHTVVGRAVQILDCVATAAGPLPLAALTRQTGIPKPTVRRIANDLTERGMLELTSTGYLAGSRLINQGLHSAHNRGVSVTAQPYVQDLHLQTRGQFAWFATMDHGDDLTMTATAFGRAHAAAMHRSLNVSLSELGSSKVVMAAGRLQVSHQPEVADRILSTGWAPLTRYSVTDRLRLRNLLREAHDTGMAYEAEQTMLGWTCLAAAVRDSAGQLLGAIGVSGRGTNVDARGIGSALIRCAESLATDLMTRSAPEAS